MTTTTRSEAAERMRLARLVAERGVIEAFAAERRATVERIVAILERKRDGYLSTHSKHWDLDALIHAILDEEAAR